MLKLVALLLQITSDDGRCGVKTFYRVSIEKFRNFLHHSITQALLRTPVP